MIGPEQDDSKARMQNRDPARWQDLRPHVRRAHAHLYWSGTGRKIPRVRFLLPIPVRGAPIPEEAPYPSETPVL